MKLFSAKSGIKDDSQRQKNQRSDDVESGHSVYRSEHKRLSLLFKSDNQQKDSNCQERSQNIKSSHKISDVHNDNYLTAKRLAPQRTTETIRPEATKKEFVGSLLKSGAKNTEAKKTWATSREISDSTLSFEFEEKLSIACLL